MRQLTDGARSQQRSMRQVAPVDGRGERAISTGNPKNNEAAGLQRGLGLSKERPNGVEIEMLDHVEGHDEIEVPGSAASRKRRSWRDRREARLRRSRLQHRDDFATDPTSSRGLHPASEGPVAVTDLAYAETPY